MRQKKEKRALKDESSNSAKTAMRSENNLVRLIGHLGVLKFSLTIFTHVKMYVPVVSDTWTILQ